MSVAGARRLLGVGSVVVDLVLTLDHLPEPGGDVLASGSETVVGGGVHALSAAVVAGLPAVYAGAHGTGPFGDAVRAALADRGIPALLAPTTGEDTGFCVVLVDRTGERTFATTVGAEGRLTSAQLSAVSPGAGDVVYVSGYDLAYPHAPVVAGWVAALPAGTPVVLDPGPLVAELDTTLLTAVLARAAWVSLNGREAALWTGAGDPAQAAADVLRRAPDLVGVVVRVGADGAVLAMAGSEPVTVPAVPVEQVLHTNGAGDVHVGTFVAALARGLDPVAATRDANAAAAARVAGRSP